jgi:hypothetical protein
VFGQVLSSGVKYRQGEENSETFALYNNSVNQLTENLEKEEQISDALSLTMGHVSLSVGKRWCLPGAFHS